MQVSRTNDGCVCNHAVFARDMGGSDCFGQDCYYALEQDMNENNEVVEGLIAGMNELFDGKSTADVAHGLIVSLASLLLTQVPPQARNQAMVFMVKTLRGMVKDGERFEKQRMQ